MNQAVFEKLFVTNHGVTGADLRAPYAQLLDPNLEARLEIEKSKSVSELLAMNDETNLNYEKITEVSGDPSEYVVHRVERPDGLLPVDRRNPGTYCRRRGSNVSLLAGGLRNS